MENSRQIAMKWWNSLASLRKTQICDTNTELIGSVRRHETLTGSEIEKLWKKETITKGQVVNYLLDEKLIVVSTVGFWKGNEYYIPCANNKNVIDDYSLDFISFEEEFILELPKDFVKMCESMFGGNPNKHAGVSKLGTGPGVKRQELNHSELGEEIPEPIGKFILDNVPIEKQLEMPNGIYFHYADVCTLLKLYGRK